MLSLRIEEDFSGPTLREIEFLLDGCSGEVEVKWGNTKAEVRLLQKVRHRFPELQILLVVPSLVAMERTASTLGLKYLVERKIAFQGLDLLNKPTGGWRDWCLRTGPYLARSVVIGAVARQIRKGGDAQPLRKLLVESVFENTSPVDLDLLLGLRLKGARV